MLEHGVQLNHIKLRSKVVGRHRICHLDKRHAGIAAKMGPAGGEQSPVNVCTDKTGVRIHLQQHIQSVAFSTTKIQNLQIAVA